MTAYYNENDDFVASWLEDLIKAKIIADGTVDRRSILDVRSTDLEEFAQCHFFAGIGVWSYALRQSGWPDDRPVWTGSCPCQPFSIAGEGKGTEDKRHLWPYWFPLIKKSKPIVLFGEQVASKSTRIWFDTVSNDLEGVGYTVGAAITAACGFGAPHPRKRLYFVGHTEREGLPRSVNNQRIFSAAQEALTKSCNDILRAWWDVETSPTTLPSLDGTPLWLARKFLHGYGNALCAPQAQAFIEAYLSLED